MNKKKAKTGKDIGEERRGGTPGCKCFLHFKKRTLPKKKSEKGGRKRNDRELREWWVNWLEKREERRLNGDAF